MSVIFDCILIACFGYVLYDVHRNVKIIKEEMKKPRDEDGED